MAADGIDARHLTSAVFPAGLAARGLDPAAGPQIDTPPRSRSRSRQNVMWAAPNRNRRGPYSIQSRPHTNRSRPHRIQPDPNSIRRRPHRIRRAPCINRSGANRIRTGQHTIRHLRTGSGPRHQVGSAGPLHHGLRPLKPGRALNHQPPAHPCRPHRQTMCTGAQSLFMGAKIMMTRAQTLSTSAHSLSPPAQIMSTGQQPCRRPRHTGLIALSIIHRPATTVFSYQQLCCRRPHRLLRSAQNDLGPQNIDPAHGQSLVTAAQCMWALRLQRLGAASALYRSERPRLTAAWSISSGR